jgi:hypothetical protein
MRLKVELATREKEQRQHERKERQAAFRKLLEESSSVKVDSQWRKVHERLEDQPACHALDKQDRLEVFQEYIRELERKVLSTRPISCLRVPVLLYESRK